MHDIKVLLGQDLLQFFPELCGLEFLKGFVREKGNGGKFPAVEEFNSFAGKLELRSLCCLFFSFYEADHTDFMFLRYTLEKLKDASCPPMSPEMGEIGTDDEDSHGKLRTSSPMRVEMIQIG
jgi:hypothetical protein